MDSHRYPRTPLRQFLVSREFGGAADIALHLARDWRDDRGANAEVWLPGEGRAAEVVRATALPMRRYDLDGASAASRWRAVRANLVVGARLAALPAGIQHIHTPMAYGALWRAFRRARGPSIVHVHLDYQVEAMRWAFRSPPACIVTCARFMVDRVREALPDSLRDTQRIAVIPNAVNTERFFPGDKLAAKQKVGAPLDRPLVLMLANLAPHKGQLTAVRAVAELVRGGLQMECWLAGVDRADGAPFQTTLQQEIRGLGLIEHAQLLGFRDDAPDLLRAADLLLLPSTSEGLPLTLLEAQASQVPVLAAPTAGIPEIIEDGKTGCLLPAHDFKSYAAAMRELLVNRTWRERMVRTAYEQCLHSHCWANYFGQMCDLYAELKNPQTASHHTTATKSQFRCGSHPLANLALHRETSHESLA